MIRDKRTPSLKHYVARYKFYKEMLENYPEQKELLERKIAMCEKDIIAYVTSKSFECALNNLSL